MVSTGTVRLRLRPEVPSPSKTDGVKITAADDYYEVALAA